MKNVLIVGYPKSGTTWLTLLVSDILQAPVKGYWGSDHQELASSNLHRESDFCCYKSHACYSELQSNSEIDKIVYILRDPRSVTDSIKHYFYAPRIKSKSFPAKVINKLLWLTGGRTKMEVEAANAVLYGSAGLNINLKLSWQQHYLPFKNDKSVYFIKYEDLLSKGVEEIVKLSKFFNLEMPEKNSVKLLDGHSFTHMKKRYQTEKNTEGLYLMRSGKLNSWRQNLASDTISKLNTGLQADLQYFNYPL